MAEGKNYLDFKKLCRLCLKSAGNIPIFAAIGVQLSLPLRIRACTGLIMRANKSLPNHICSECRYQLEKSYYFRKRALLTESKLREHLRLQTLNRESCVFSPEDTDADKMEVEASVQFIKEQDVERNKMQQELPSMKKSKKAIIKKKKERCFNRKIENKLSKKIKEELRAQNKAEVQMADEAEEDEINKILKFYDESTYDEGDIDFIGKTIVCKELKSPILLVGPNGEEEVVNARNLVIL